LHEKYIKNAEERLSAAEYLLKGRYYNDAVSRAYYSMFYAARALLSAREIYPKGHKGVILKFGLEFVREDFIEKVYGRALSHAKDEEKPQIMMLLLRFQKKKLNPLWKMQRSS